jgi:hypothetical protein
MLRVRDLREWLKEDWPDTARVCVDVHYAALHPPVDLLHRSEVQAASLEWRNGTLAIVVIPEHDPTREKELRSHVAALGMGLRQAKQPEVNTRAVMSDWVIEGEGQVHVFGRLEDVAGWLEAQETP